MPSFHDRLVKETEKNSMYSLAHSKEHSMAETTRRQTGIAEVNGTTLYYEVAGAGHPFLLIHGGLVNIDV